MTWWRPGAARSPDRHARTRACRWRRPACLRRTAPVPATTRGATARSPRRGPAAICDQYGPPSTWRWNDWPARGLPRRRRSGSPCRWPPRRDRSSPSVVLTHSPRPSVSDSPSPSARRMAPKAWRFTEAGSVIVHPALRPSPFTGTSSVSGSKRNTGSVMDTRLQHPRKHRRHAMIWHHPKIPI